MKAYNSPAFRRFNIVSWEIDDLYHSISKSFGLTDSENNILYLLSFEGNKAPLSYINRYAGLTKQTINSALRKMEKEDLIILSFINGKEKEVSLTQKGIALSKSTVSKLIEAENRVIESFDEKDFAFYLDCSEKYLNNLKKFLKEYREENRNED